MSDLLEYLRNLSEVSLGVLGLFGGFLTKIAPPERAAWIWSGLASVIAAVVFLSVRLVFPVHATAGSVHLWTIVAIACCGLGVVMAFVQILLRQARTVDYFGTEKIIGAAYTQAALDYKSSNPGFTDDSVLRGFTGKVDEVWSDVAKSRRILGMSYALMLVLMLFGLCLGVELAIHPPTVDPPKVAPTLAERAAALKEIHFALDKSELSGDAIQILDGDAALVKEISRDFKGMVVTVEGYCDDQGSAERNVELGFKRARKAGEELVGAGVPAAMVRFASFGKSSPVCSGTTEDCRQKNRRVRLSVSE